MKLAARTLGLIAVAGMIISGGIAAAAPMDASAPAQGAALTIYNQNFAVVRDTIPLDLTSGINHIRYTGITAQLEPDSVILRDPSGKRDLRVIEQNYRGDTVSQGQLLALNEGKTITFEVLGANGAAPTYVQGKIIRSGYNPGSPQYNPYGYNPNQPNDQALIQVGDTLRFGLPGTPLFPALADDSILTPTLEWTIDSDKAGPVNAELAYITNGMSWKAAYNVVAPETGDNLDITAWVTIDNECGKEFDDAHIKLMAGDVNKIQPNQGNIAIDGFAMVEQGNGNSLNPQVTQKSFDEYHLYTLPIPTTLRNHETKQVQFLRAPNVASNEIYVYDGLKLDTNQYNGWGYQNIRNQNDYGTQYSTKVAVEREFVNSEANGLGVPLPAGRVRFYRRDSDGQLEFIGEDNIDHTPKDETVKFVTGDAFDIVGSRIQTAYHVDQQNNNADESFAITLKNHKTTPVEVRVIEHLYRGDNWTITAHSDTFLKTDAHTMEFRVQVPPSGEKTVTYTAHYTW